MIVTLGDTITTPRQGRERSCLGDQKKEVEE